MHETCAESGAHIRVMQTQCHERLLHPVRRALGKFHQRWMLERVPSPWLRMRDAPASESDIYPIWRWLRVRRNLKCAGRLLRGQVPKHWFNVDTCPNLTKSHPPSAVEWWSTVLADRRKGRVPAGRHPPSKQRDLVKLDTCRPSVSLRSCIFCLYADDDDPGGSRPSDLAEIRMQHTVPKWPSHIELQPRVFILYVRFSAHPFFRSQSPSPSPPLSFSFSLKFTL
jgi:hypothetical protein